MNENEQLIERLNGRIFALEEEIKRLRADLENKKEQVARLKRERMWKP
jgi:phage shock protein A